MQNNFCWVIQLFSLVCTVKGYYDCELLVWGRSRGLGGAGLGCCLTRLHLCLPAKAMAKDDDCTLPVEEAGIMWDSICFFFLLLQRRIFLSSYYLHVMWDLQASALQPSRWDWGPGGSSWVLGAPLTLHCPPGVWPCSRPAS